MKHIHHWIIAPPHGDTSLGTCPCGAVREFDNFPCEADPEFNNLDGKVRTAICPICGTEFKTRHHAKKYDKPECAQAANLPRQRRASREHKRRVRAEAKAKTGAAA